MMLWYLPKRQVAKATCPSDKCPRWHVPKWQLSKETCFQVITTQGDSCPSMTAALVRQLSKGTTVQCDIHIKNCPIVKYYIVIYYYILLYIKILGPNKHWPNVFAGGLHMFEIHSVFPWNFHLLRGNFVKSPGMNFFSGEGSTPGAL